MFANIAVPIPNPLFIGIALQYEYQKGHHPRFGVYVHDGFWSWDFYEKGFPSSTIKFVENGIQNNDECNKYEEPVQLDYEVIKHIKQYQQDKQCKIIMAGLVNCDDERLIKIGRHLWFELDILPCIFSARGSTLDEKACAVARKTSQYIYPIGIPGLCKVNVGYRMK
jgi:hypothetical protein